MIEIASAFAAGVWLLQQQAQLHTPVALAFTIAAAMFSYLARPTPAAPWLRLMLALLAGFTWANWRAEVRLNDALDPRLDGVEIVVTGVVRGLPAQSSGVAGQGWRFSLETESAEVLNPDSARSGESGLHGVPKLLSLGWYDRVSAGETEEAPRLVPGERWQLLLRLRRPHGNANPYGFDAEAWLLEQNLRATGTVRPSPQNRRLDAFAASFDSVVDRVRYRIEQRILSALPHAPYAQVMVALVVGEQRGINADDWQVFSRTGVGHLISISGLHITMTAALASAIAAWLWNWAVRARMIHGKNWHRRQCAAIAGLMTAALYTLLAGAAVPAQRTLWMLCVVGLASLLNRGSRMSHVLALSMIAVLLLDPWAVLSPGFWLSFVAVGCLMYADAQASGLQARSNSNGLPRGQWWQRVVETVKTGARAQIAVTVGMVPVTLIFFQQVSLVSPIANAIAIPIVSAVVTPAAISGALLGIDWPLQLAHLLFLWLARALQALSIWQYASLEWPAPGTWAVVLSMLGLGWLAAPRGIPGRWAGLALLAPLLLTLHPSPADGSFQSTVFDAGQGMAVLVETARHQLIYDTGPRYGEDADAGTRVLVPHLRAIGMANVDTLMVSHRDMDHAGGAISVLSSRKIGRLLTSIEPGDRMLPPDALIERCEAGQHWIWDGVDFSVLHPTAQDYLVAASTNARSCVLRVQAGRQTLLLAGDIEAAQERALLNRVPESVLHATALLVPHHGSLTSSTVEFVAAVQPQVAIIQAGWHNRFGHPRAEVLARYEHIGADLLRTDHDGQLVLQFNPENVRVSSWREQNPRYWHGR